MQANILNWLAHLFVFLVPLWEFRFSTGVEWEGAATDNAKCDHLREDQIYRTWNRQGLKQERVRFMVLSYEMRTSAGRLWGEVRVIKGREKKQNLTCRSCVSKHWALERSSSDQISQFLASTWKSNKHANSLPLNHIFCTFYPPNHVVRDFNVTYRTLPVGL